MYDRSKSIGASDAVLIAAGQWAELYDRKNTPPDALSYPLPARIGHACEAVNREWFEQETGIHVVFEEVWDVDQAEPIEHAEYPWMKYLPDGVVDHKLDSGAEVVVPWEGKAVNGMWQPHLLIKKYTPQLLHQMRVIAAPFAYLSVLYLNTKWDYYKIEWDEPAADELLEQEKQFMWHLENEVRPPEFKGKRKGWIE